MTSSLSSAAYVKYNNLSKRKQMANLEQGF